MKPGASRRIIDRYSRRHAEHGFSPRTLGWTNGRQGVRFDALLSQWNFRGATVLDVGCGFGDLYRFCRERRLGIEYTGVDINADLVAEGRRQYPRADLRVGDVFETGIPSTYDYIVCSGMFNTRQAGNWTMIRTAFELFGRHARNGFAANFLSTVVDYRVPGVHYSDPARVLKLAYEISNRVVLRNDYMPFEFTVFVDRRDGFDRKTGVYGGFEALADWKKP